MNIVVELPTAIITESSDELLLTSKIKDKYIFWEEFKLGDQPCIVWFNTTDFSNKQLIDSWNNLKDKFNKAA